MKALEFLIFLRDEKHACPTLKTGKPSNNELRQFLKDDVVQLNGKFLRTEDDNIEWPPESLIFWPNHKGKEGQMSRKATIF